MYNNVLKDHTFGNAELPENDENQDPFLDETPNKMALTFEQNSTRKSFDVSF